MDASATNRPSVTAPSMVNRKLLYGGTRKKLPAAVATASATSAGPRPPYHALTSTAALRSRSRLVSLISARQHSSAIPATTVRIATA